MSADEPVGLDLGPIDQVAYVVEDMDAALPHYEEIFGPFEIMDSPIVDCTIRGHRTNCRLKLAMNRSGPIEIELIEVLEGDTPHSEHLRAHGEGLHHVRFRVEALEARAATLNALGYETIMFKRFGPEIAFAYLEAPAQLGKSVIELLEMP